MFYKIKRNPVTGKYEGLTNIYQPTMSKETAIFSAVGNAILFLVAVTMAKKAKTSGKKAWWLYMAFSNLFGVAVNAEVARTLHKEDEEISQFEEGWLARS